MSSDDGTASGPITAAAGARPAGFQRREIGVGGEEQVKHLTSMLDVQAAQPSVIRLRDWVFDRLAPRPGETAVDVGSGTGETVIRLAGAVGELGRAIGIEPNPALRAVAADRASAARVQAEFLDGAAGALPFADGSVDLVTCERVLQHLDDADAAVREFARVLRPGGRVVVIDSDWATGVIHPGDPEVVSRYQRFSLTQWPNPHSGRLLRSQLLAAGLEVDPDIGSSALVLPDGAFRGGGMMAMSAPAAIASGAVTAEELAGLISGLEAAAEHGRAFFSVTMFAVLGRRPAH
ncbi:MAG: methyltransferase domain-containing protein [Actinomycetales bacterium]|jgi:SAM-dependent methyltransferase|uniref:Methyltransferase domain-containing protein n=1 Tax=Candidatus Phosphoribacter hodrii TaxID=2953743 RepID=A0A935ILR1_9MICO|nr:methyltransferase domain-containing protein [Candidatus Phosphoribacter hodrii]OPZ50719.1 MAG: Ubiquinone/menaquinone biosynthesis C-methyltransferase UbiE [bacterium ADurb.BinA028]HNV15780.1 methyltransferase domain-containing protein [Dermatophilaceae bacterium]HOF38420.1 methyltransferase domain-containing protein [Dermatophilaceae bacterium]HPZ70359.1 methyltransferase domain-containing protein [Dermatophilaceae bacterium]